MLALVGWAMPTLAQDVQVSARVDKASVDLGEQITLTITAEGDLSGVKLEPPQFPPSFLVVAHSQASNVSMQLGKISRSVSLTYVLIPRELGTFELGPFRMTHRGKSLQTDVVKVVVGKSALPPKLNQVPQQRYLL